MSFGTGLDRRCRLRRLGRACEEVDLVGDGAFERLAADEVDGRGFKEDL